LLTHDRINEGMKPVRRRLTNNQSVRSDNSRERATLTNEVMVSLEPHARDQIGFKHRHLIDLLADGLETS
jgi:hypothetical protein